MTRTSSVKPCPWCGAVTELVVPKMTANTAYWCMGECGSAIKPDEMENPVQYWKEKIGDDVSSDLYINRQY